MDAFWRVSYETHTEQTKFGHSSDMLDLQGDYKGNWAVTSPGKDSNWKNSNMHWFDVIDEESREETLQVLRRGGFDTVLNAIGKEFSSDGLVVVGMGFIVTSHCTGAVQHVDDPYVGDHFFDLLFPLGLPKNEKAQLYIADETNDRRSAPVDYTMDVGILMSGDTEHATGDCDYRHDKGLRVAVSIYIADMNEKIAKMISQDGTALFPVPFNTDWLMAQKGRHWEEGKSLAHDKGRKPFTAKDKLQDCGVFAKVGLCEKDPWYTRVNCQKSCKIFMDDEQYYNMIGRSNTDEHVAKTDPVDISETSWTRSLPCS